MANSVFNCIINTLKTVFPNIYPYHTYVPSFGDWGFIIGAEEPLEESRFAVDINVKTVASAVRGNKYTQTSKRKVK